MKIKFFITVVVLLFLSGCAYTEPNAQYTVTALGFSVEDESMKVFLQAIDASGGERNGQPLNFTAIGSGQDVKAAVGDIRKQLSKKPSFKHCQLVLVSPTVNDDGLNSVIAICRELDISLKTRLALCRDINSMLTNEKIPSGTDLEALIKQNSVYFGYGGHTALFEIATAILAAEGNFALPVLTSYENKVAVEGLLRYSQAIPREYLSVEESILYAKENKIYEGGKG